MVLDHLRSALLVEETAAEENWVSVSLATGYLLQKGWVGSTGPTTVADCRDLLLSELRKLAEKASSENTSVRHRGGHYQRLVKIRHFQRSECRQIEGVLNMLSVESPEFYLLRDSYESNRHHETLKLLSLFGPSSVGQQPRSMVTTELPAEAVAILRRWLRTGEDFHCLIPWTTAQLIKLEEEKKLQEQASGAPMQPVPRRCLKSTVTDFLLALRVVTFPGIATEGFTVRGGVVLLNLEAIRRLAVVVDDEEGGGSSSPNSNSVLLWLCLVAVHEFAHYARRHKQQGNDDASKTHECLGSESGYALEEALTGEPRFRVKSEAEVVQLLEWDGTGRWPIVCHKQGSTERRVTFG